MKLLVNFLENSLNTKTEHGPFLHRLSLSQCPLFALQQWRPSLANLTIKPQNLTQFVLPSYTTVWQKQ